MTLHVPSFATSRVLVAGDLMLDRYWLGLTQRISPEAPVPVVNIKKHEDRAGGAANVAMNLMALGAEAALCGIVGHDSDGEILMELMHAAGVQDFVSHYSSARTITKLRVLSRNQQLIRLDTEDNVSEHVAHSIASKFEQALGQCTVVVLSDYAKGALLEAQQLIQTSLAHSKQVLVDPKGTDFGKYRGASLLTPNMAEFEAVVGQCKTVDEIAQRGARLREEFNLGALLVTRSAQGMTLIEENQVTHYPAIAREVYDVTGAGDTVIATLAAALAANQSLQNSVGLANLAASIAVGKLGVATVSRSELRQTLHRRGIGGRGLLELPQLIEYVEEAKHRNEKVVFTNGCFDLLHAGHVAYLEEAKALGSRLIVALNSDDSVTRLKGAGRPINPLADRLAVMSGLAAVDWVIPFSQDTPLELIQALSPNILVKGGDYRVDDIVGADWVIEHDGEVKVLSFKEGRSTTEIINAIRQSS